MQARASRPKDSGGGSRLRRQPGELLVAPSTVERLTVIDEADAVAGNEGFEAKSSVLITG